MQAQAGILPATAVLPACDDRLARLYSYWQSIRPSPEALPGRQHFDPASVRDLLPLIWLIDVQREPLRFKYRLVGTTHVEAEGCNRTGQWLDEAHERFTASTAYPQFVAVATEGRVAFYRGPPVYVIKKDYIAIERLILPLAQNGRDVGVLLGMTVLNPREAGT